MSTANEPGRAMGNSPPWAALLLFAIAVDLAAPWLCVDPSRDLHGDEALYAYYGGRMAFDHDWYIRRGFEPVVKPPLLPAAIGVSLAVLGGTRAAEQLPNRVLGIAGTIAAFGLAASLGGPTAGWFAALLVTTSTRWRFYACSSFTDLGMVAMLLAGAWSLAAGRWRLAGALATASFGFKQFGLLAMAYGLALAMVLDVARPGTGRRFGRSRNWMVGSALVGLPVLWWCSQTAPRWGPFVAGGHPFSSPVALSVETGGFFSRLRFWVAAFLEASPLPGWLTLAAAGFGLRDARVRPGLAGIGLGVCGYLLVISLSSLPLCDRYALFASPFLLVLAGLGLAGAAGLAGRLTPMPRWAASGLLGAAALASVAGTWVRFDFSNLESWQPRLDEAITGLCGRAGRSSLLLMPELPWILYHRLQVMDRFLEARCYGPGRAGIAEQVAARGPRGVCVFVDAHNSAVDPALHTWLNGRTPHGRRIVLRTEGGRTLFSLYRIPPAEPPPSHDPGDWRGDGTPVPFRCGVHLLGIRSRVVRGGVRLETLWTCAPPPKRDWSIVFNLVDARGTRLGAAWVRPGDGTYPTSQWKAGERVLALLPSVSVTLWDRVGRVELGLRDELGFQTDRRTDTGVRSIWLDKSAIPAAREGVGGRVPRPSVAIP